MQLSFLLLLSAISTSVSADETAPAAADLFISSAPLNAVILIDGKPSLQKTPALIAGISSGSHMIGIRKEGFTPLDIEVSLLPGSTEVITAELSSGSVILNLPGAESVYLRTESDKPLPDTFRLPEGEFRISADEERYYIEPIYPNEGLLTVTSVLFITSAVLTNAAIINELSEAGEINLPHSWFLSIAEISALVTGVFEIALLTDKKNYLKNYRIYGADLSTLESEAEIIYQSAQRSLSVGNLEESLSGFTRIIGEFPDSARFPESLYKVAKIHIISGDTNLAVSELKIIIENFPDPGIFDKACQTLALLYYNNDQLAESKSSVEKMVFHDPLFSDTQGNIEAFGIEKVIENWAHNPERQAD